MMKNAKKILFPAVAAASMIASGHSAALLTAKNPDYSMPLIDSAVTASQFIQLPVGGSIDEGPAGTAVGTVNIKIIPLTSGQRGHCTFYLSDAFGASATAPAPAATISGDGCENVDLYFVQKATAASTAYAMIRIKDTFKNVFYYSPIIPTTKLTFCKDTAGSESITPVTLNSMPPKQAANQPLETIPNIVYLRNADDLDQLKSLIISFVPKLPPADAAKIAEGLRPLFVDKRSNG
ncbi:MAG: hypothetical protein HEEMFOPI_01543 [Holosporales bacterium]